MTTMVSPPTSPTPDVPRRRCRRRGRTGVAVGAVLAGAAAVSLPGCYQRVVDERGFRSSHDRVYDPTETDGPISRFLFGGEEDSDDG